ncbi:MAG: Gldg family protein [Pseudomonadota bacterium]|nr:Gldg family protein [Pseudomonadota bacterium]
MKKLWIVCKNELYRYFVSPLAYVYLLSFLLLNASFALYFGDFFNRGQADLQSVFVFQPWLYLLFIPGISMRLWAEEFRNKTIVQLITMPVSVSTLVCGKFLAAWSFCGLALIMTFPFWITVNLLGTPDNSVIALGFLASFVLSGCMLAISETMSALTKNQVIALVLAVIANLMFFWSGIEYILSFFRLFLPDTIIDVIASFSFLSHFATLSLGLVELRDIIFFVSVIFFFNFTTILIVNFKTAGTSGWLKSNSRSYYIVAWSMLLIAFLGINILANGLTRNIQYDATEKKIFTLTEDSRKILQNLPEPVLAKLYFSPILEQRNPALRTVFDNMRLLLQKCKTASGGKFDFKIYYPDFLSEEEDIALANGLQPIPLIDLNQNALFGMTLEDTLQNKQVIPFFAQERQGHIEQDLISKIRNLHHKKKTIGVITGLALFGTNSKDGAFLGQPWQIVDLWRENYEIINIVRPEDFNYHFDVLILFYPQPYKQEFVKAIKDYSRQGGKILLLLDPANEASRLYSAENYRLVGTDLGELADFWHIKFYKDYVVADLENSITVDATSNYKTNPTFSQDVIQFRIKKDGMNYKHPVTKNLNEILLTSASVIMPDMKALKAKKIKFEPLLKASSLSAIMPSSVVSDGLSPQEILRNFEPDDNAKILAAEFIGLEPDNPFDVIAITDTDFLYDTFWGTKKSFLESEYLVENSDNANFIMNILDYLSGNPDLLALRGKTAQDHPFGGIEIMRRINSLLFTQKENAIFAEIDKAKQSMQEVWSKKDFEGRENFTADELAAISKVRTNLNELRRQLSDIREQAFADIKKIETLVSLANLLLIPVLLTLLLLGFRLKRRWHKNSRRVGELFKMDKPLLKLTASCLFIFLLALISVYFANRSSVDAYEGKKAFPEVEKQLNNINRVELTSNTATLRFVFKDGLWILEGHEDIPVYQERIRRLLTTVAEARFFERKTNKAENLGMFNLAPLEDKDSKVVRIELKNGDTSVQRFDLGDINIDLGRGSRAAYIKFDNQFQVWEITGDFIDMDLDFHKWTYSNLWDLRYGRLYSPSNYPEEQDKLMMLMKYALNTRITPTGVTLTSKPVKSKKLYIENGNYVVLSLYKENGKTYAVLDFDENNTGSYLKLAARYLNKKPLEIEAEQMEKILEQL